MQINPFSLNNRTIMITGASSGLGKSIARMCSESGARVVITGRNGERLKDTFESLKGKDHLAFIADLTDETSLCGLIENLPQLDGIVLCAGVNSTLPLRMFSRKKIDTIFEVNFFSQVELIRLLLKKKLLSDRSSIVAISSIGGNEVFTPGASAYGASKAALLSWMKTAAMELAPRIRVNCICPGQVNTPMNSNSNISDEQYERYRQSIPLNRFAEPEDIAPSAIFLLSDASSWITGTQIVIDGGSSL